MASSNLSQPKTPSLPDASPKPQNKLCLLALLILLLIGVVIRVIAAGEPAWLDECHTAWTVDADSISMVASRAADGNQPPLFFALTWCVTQLFGLSEFSLRVISLFSGSLLILVAALWTRSLTQRWSAALLVAALITFDGQFIYYASEARPYALVQLLGLLQAICFWRLVTVASRRITQAIPLLILLLLSIALLYTHYTSVWILVAETIIVFGIAISRRKLPLEWLALTSLIAVSMLPVWWNVSMVFNRRSNWSSVSSTGQLWSDYEPWLVHWVMIPAAFAIAGALLNYIKPAAATEPSIPRRLWIWITIWALLGPLAIATIDALGIAPMALERYAIVCWVAIAMFAGLAVTLYRPNISWLIAALIFGSSLLGNWWVDSCIHVGGLTPFRIEDWATPIAQIADIESSEPDSHQPIFQFANVIEDIDALTIDDARFQTYLLFPTLGAEALSKVRLSETHSLTPLATLNPVFTEQHLDAIRDAGGCWLIIRGVREFSLVFPGELEHWLGEPIEFKEVPNPHMSYSNVHLLRIRIVPAVTSQ